MYDRRKNPMHIVRHLIAAVVFIAVASSIAIAAPLTLYVAADGNDAWSGRLSEVNAARTDGPLATIAGARDAIRRLRRSNDDRAAVTVLLREGTYRMAAPFVLLPCDSGVTYAAYPDEKPVLSGGRIIRNWEPGPGNLWRARVSDVAKGKWYFRQLFVNGGRRIRARAPSEEWFTVAGKAPPKVDAATGNEVARDRTAFVFCPGDVNRWPRLNDNSDKTRTADRA